MYEYLVQIILHFYAKTCAFFLHTFVHIFCIFCVYFVPTTRYFRHVLTYFLIFYFCCTMHTCLHISCTFLHFVAYFSIRCHSVHIFTYLGIQMHKIACYWMIQPRLHGCEAMRKSLQVLTPFSVTLWSSVEILLEP